MRCFKQLKAFKFFKDGHVQEIKVSSVKKVATVSSNPRYCHQCAKTEWVAIVKETGKVFSADCNCTAGYVSKVDFLLASSLICLSAGQLG